MKARYVTAPLAAAAIAAAVMSCSSNKTGTESIGGQTSSMANVPTVPLHATGIFTDTGTLTLSGSGGSGTGTLKFSHGNLTVYHSTQHPLGNGLPPVNPVHCTFSGAENGTFKVTSGTGSYEGASGQGVYKVSFTGQLPRLPSGKCNLSQNAQPTSVETTFLATGTLTVKS